MQLYISSVVRIHYGPSIDKRGLIQQDSSAWLQAERKQLAHFLRERDVEMGY